MRATGTCPLRPISNVTRGCWPFRATGSQRSAILSRMIFTYHAYGKSTSMLSLPLPCATPVGNPAGGGGGVVEASRAVDVGVDDGVAALGVGVEVVARA